jgi:EAL and modified HD-GYP domain-containing signal transduction protein
MASASFPLVESRSIANAQNEWVALLLHAAGQATDGAFLQTVFGASDFLDAIAPLDCIVLVDDPAILTPPVLNVLPPDRVLLAVHAAALALEGMARRLAELQLTGYRVLLDGDVPAGATRPAVLRTVARDCSAAAPVGIALPALFGPHLAYGVDSIARFQECENAGFAWFGGDYVLDSVPEDDDGTSRRRMMTMLALLARDADSHELEHQLKQDPALSYHLLKLVNSAAFTSGITITSFGQAISRIGRRQLQRWLQLLLYARQSPDGPPNLLLPLAALRGGALEALSKREGGDRDAQDLAFMTGVFSLLDRLFRTPMDQLVPELHLAAEVEAALLRREGTLGQRLRLAEAKQLDASMLAGAGIDGATWWECQLAAYRWAIQVARNV